MGVVSSPVYDTYYIRSYGVSSRRKFNWMPYYQSDIQQCLPPMFFEGADTWCAITPLLHFAIVEIHVTDRVFRQFGFHQPIEMSIYNIDDLHKVDVRGKHSEDWSRKHATFIYDW
ncbi:serine/threonine-protein phosphatase 7 long form homolog [Hibiscus syriacus]|uniref:serine/threonine-protein phosphatase 7 long form homolog n=1 Tax=Hibiscus syriacus TaxID=106335 RepID=UPI001924CDD1|nr:serine/threonine-protein phosphatase 7 long form homolog [Hibiscus syriacus]